MNRAKYVAATMVTLAVFAALFTYHRQLVRLSREHEFFVKLKSIETFNDAPSFIVDPKNNRRFTFSKSSSVEPYLRFKIRDFISSGCVLRMRLKVPASAAKSCFVRSAKSSGENGTICGDVVCFAIDMAPLDQFIWADGFCYVGVAFAKDALRPGDVVELADFKFALKGGGL